MASSLFPFVGELLRHEGGRRDGGTARSRPRGGGRRGSGRRAGWPSRRPPSRMKTTSLTGRGLVSFQSVDEGVEDEVALGPPRLPLRVGLAEGVVALRGCPGPGSRRRRRGRRWRRRRRSGRRRGPGCTRPMAARTPSATSANVISVLMGTALLTRRRFAHDQLRSQKPRSTTGRSSGFTLIDAQRREQPLVGKAGQEAVDGPLEVRDAALDPLGQAHVLEALRVQAPLLPGQVREVLGGDRRPPGVVVLPRLGRRGLRPARCPPGSG